MKALGEIRDIMLARSKKAVSTAFVDDPSCFSAAEGKLSGDITSGLAMRRTAVSLDDAESVGTSGDRGQSRGNDVSVER